MTVSTFKQPDNSAQTGAEYKANIDGAIQVHHRIAGAFACHQNDQGSPDAPDMTVRVDAGSIFDGVTLTEVAAQSTSALTAPVSNPRKDIIYIDRATGVVGVAAGSEAASPSDPAIPSGKLPVARINWTVGMVEITNADLDDLRSFGPAPIFVGPDNGSPSVDGKPGLVPPATAAQYGYVLYTTGWGAAPGADQVARDMAASALALADANGTAGPVGAFYLADPFTADTLAVKTNASYDSGNDWYANDLIATGSSASFGGSVVGSNAANMIDGNDATYAQLTTLPNWSAETNLNNRVIAYIDLGASYPLSDITARLADPTNITGSICIAYSTDASSWTQLGANILNSDINSTPADITRSGSITARYVGVFGTQNNYGGAGADFRIYTLKVTKTAAPNMTLRPTPVTMAVADPLDVMFYFLIDPVDSITMGTDVIGKVSIADGSPEDFVTGTWADRVGTYGNFELWRLDVDMTGKTGSTLVYSIETANNKQIRFKQSVGCVPLY